MSAADGGLGLVRLMRVAVALGVVSVLAYVGLRLWARYRSGAAGDGQLLEVLGRLSLDAGTQVVLVRVAERRVLLGVAPGGVNLLLELDTVRAPGASLALPDSALAAAVAPSLGPVCAPAVPGPGPDSLPPAPRT